jgi:hypothetical protein
MFIRDLERNSSDSASGKGAFLDEISHLLIKLFIFKVSSQDVVHGLDELLLANTTQRITTCYFVIFPHNAEK